MKSIIASVSIASAMLISLVGVPTQASAQEAPLDGVPYVMPIDRFAKNINEPCDRGEKAHYKSVVKVVPGTGGAFLNGEKGFGVLMLTNGRPLIHSDYPVSTTDYQTNEFYWYGGRFSAIDLDSEFNKVVFEGVGPIMTFSVGKVRKTCRSEGYGM